MKNILILEDNSDLAEGLREVLGDVLKVNVLSTESGVEALQHVQSNPVDLCLFDVNLPDIDGITVLSKIRAQHHQMPVLFMTGFRWPQVALEAFPNDEFTHQLLSDTQKILAMFEQERSSRSIHFIATETQISRDELAHSVKANGYCLIERCDYDDVAYQDCAGLVYLVEDYFSAVLAHLRFVKDRGFEGPVIAIRHTDGNSLRDPFNTFQITGCIFKPFDLVDMLSLVEERL
ncbi:MAG: response regulator [Gammaproteobacteria bacterium]|nr:response regulator [Gammaproteobacteria bacterium]